MITKTVVEFEYLHRDLSTLKSTCVRINHEGLDSPSQTDSCIFSRMETGL
jgi:hypothetical protein